MENLISGSPSLARDINETNILHLIKDQGPISRVEIAKKIGISQTAVSRLVYRLIEKNIIVEKKAVNTEVHPKQSRRSVGRQPTLLYLNKIAANIVGIDLGRETTVVVVADLAGDTLLKKAFQTDLTQDRNSMLSTIVDAIYSCLTASSISPDSVIGIGIVLPGYVDAARGILRTSSSLIGWDNFEVSKFFEDKFNIATHVEGDVKALTLAEYTLGNGNRCSDMICLCITDAGPCAGIICNGQLIRGITDSSGQIGSLKIGYSVRQKNLCRYLHVTDDTVFDQIVTPQALVESAQKAILQGEESILKKDFVQNERLTISNILDASSEGDGIAIQLLREFSEILSLLVIDMINLLNPKMLLLYGDMIEDNGIVLQVVRDNVNQHFLPLPAHSISIKPAKLKIDGYVKGGISLVLNALFTPPRFNQAIVQFTTPTGFFEN